MQTSNSAHVLFAGGGTGGHLYPEIAIAQRLSTQSGIDIDFFISNRTLDQNILQKTPFDHHALTVTPLPRRPWQAPGFLKNYYGSIRTAKQLIRQKNTRLVLATGGFVSGPVISAARKLGVHTLLLNLDAVPGKANQYLAPKVDQILSVYPCDIFPPQTPRVGLPIRENAIFEGDRQAALDRMGLLTPQNGLPVPQLQTPTLVITGASQGARSINLMMEKLIDDQALSAILKSWRVLHLCGPDQAGNLQQQYRQQGIFARVIEFTDRMSDVWGVADLVISRGGAGSIAEIAANQCPSIIMPYPYHKDQHQKKNAAELEAIQAVIIMEDLIDPEKNMASITPILMNLLNLQEKRQAMKTAFQQWPYHNGAEDVSKRIVDFIYA